MNSLAIEPAPSSSRRWLLWLALVFVAQVLLIYLLSAREQSPVRSQPKDLVSIQLFTAPLTEAEFSERFIVGDPTLFAFANPHGFSGGAWLKIPERNYDISERVTEAPFWLTLNPAQLGKSISPFVETNSVAPLSAPESPTPRIMASLIPDSMNSAKTNSVLRLEGDMASRKVTEWPTLKSWPHTEILSNSVVQIAVDWNGSVISARLLARSGLADADAAALETARKIPFSPGNQKEVWGKLIFDWHTVPLAATNSTSEISPLK